MDSIKMWAVGIVAGLVVGAALTWAKKRLPEMIAGYAAKRIDDALAAGDDADDELVLALCRWAEKKVTKEFPDGLPGDMKYKLVADKLVALMPISIRPFISSRSEKIAEVIEANVSRLKTELSKYGDRK